MNERTPLRIILDEPADGAWNMALDEALLLSGAEAEAETATKSATGGEPGIPTLRLYGFSPTIVSIGRFQKSSDLDREALAAEKLSFVRRPTGGHAVLHGDELTYSFIFPRTEARITDKRFVYRLLLPFLLRGLRGLGVDAGVFSAEDARGRIEGPDCFASSTPYEVETARGGKIVGSAQAVTRHAVLQHGSILLGGAARGLSAFLRGGKDEGRARRLRADGVAECAGRAVAFREARDAFAAAAAEFWTVVPGGTDDDESVRARRLLDERYSKPEWNERP